MLMMSDSFTTFVRALVERKHVLDTDRKNKAVADFRENWPEGWDHLWRTICPVTFIRTVIPFFESPHLLRTDGLPLAFVDPSRVIGDPCKGTVQYYSAEDKLDMLNRTHLQALEALTRPPKEPMGYRLKWDSSVDGTGYVGAYPQCWEILPFGLYFAHEGKNRVHIYQEARRPIPYEISERVFYPDACRLALEESEEGWKLWLDDKEHAVLRYCADILVPMFEAYGVKCRVPAPSPTPLPSQHGSLLQRLIVWCR